MTEHDQRRATWIATLTGLVVVAAFVAGKAARDAILLSHFAIKVLPLFIGASALISLPIIVIAGRLMARFGPARLMPALNALSAVFAIVEWVLLSRYPRPATVAIYFHLSTSGAVLVSGFWSIINERFDVQSAKRNIGRIGVGATIGGILGGLVASGTAAYLEADTILLVLAALQLTCAATLYLFRAPRRPAVVAPRGETTKFALGVVARSRLLRNVGIVVVLGAVAAGVLDYVFKADLVVHHAKADLLPALATYYLITSVLTAFIQFAICGPLIARLGVPRSVATLPLTVTAFGLVALAVPVAVTAAVARAAEVITRNSIYRAGYELLYAPLPEAEKRPTKIVLDVGAERVGDLIGAQLVGLIVFVMAAPRVGLLIAAVVTGAIAVAFALRLPGSYTSALEARLVAEDTEPNGVASVPRVETWHDLGGLPIFGQTGDVSPVPLRVLERSPRRERVTAMLGELRAREPARIRRALAAGLTPELAAHVIGLVARDDLAGEATVALRAVAPRCTGMIVDALLDPTREATLRRRLAAVLCGGEPNLAAWGLWRGLADPSFDIRYRCAEALGELSGAGLLAEVTPEVVFAIIGRELELAPDAWRAQHAAADAVMSRAAGGALEHVFTMLGLILPAEPLRIASHALQTDDSALRETALEYLDSVLPADVRAQLRPLLSGAPGAGGDGPEQAQGSEREHGADERDRDDPGQTGERRVPVQLAEHPAADE